MSKPFNILTDYKGSNNRAVDAVASCIMYFRKRHIGLKAIHLKEPYYSQFLKWTESNLGRKLEDGELVQFDKVDIDKGSVFQIKEIQPEYFEDYTRNMRSKLILS
jgi:hypothetical protein